MDRLPPRSPKIGTTMSSSPSRRLGGRSGSGPLQQGSVRRAVSFGDLPRLRPRLSYVSRQEMKGISALKEEIAKMKTILEGQKEPVQKSKTIIHTTELVIKATKARLARMEKEKEKEKSNQVAIQKLKKQITALEKYMWPKQQHVSVWESGGKKRWDDFKVLVEAMEEQLMIQESMQDPHEMRKYLETERTRLESQKSEVLRERQTIKVSVEQINHLRKRMIELAAKDYESELERFTDQGCKIEEEIEIHDRRMRKAHRMITEWEEADRQLRMCRIRYENTSGSTGPRS